MNGMDSKFMSAAESAKLIQDGDTLGRYTESPASLLCFHRLEHDEVWHRFGPASAESNSSA